MKKLILSLSLALITIIGFAQSSSTTQWRKATYTGNRTLVAADYGKNIYMNCASPCTFTIPQNADLAVPITTYFAITPMDEQVTIVEGGTTTILLGTGQALTVTKGDLIPAATFHKIENDTWQAYGLDCSTCGGGGAGVTDGDKGDITVSASGATWTIDANAVTFAKMQAITDNRLLGAQGGTTVEEITVTTPLTLSSNTLGMVNQGTTTTVLHGNASGNPSFGAVSLTADVTGTLPLSNQALEGTNTSSSLTDAGTVTITGPKHTLTSDEATITWTLSQTQDFQTTDIILNATTTTWTFPANTLCVVDGLATGNNIAVVSGAVSGDHLIMSIYKDGTNYRVAIKNFGQ